MALASVVPRALLPVVLLCVSASTFAQPPERQALADAIYAANEQLRLELGRDQVRAHQFSPEVFKQREAEINANIARVRARWADTPQRSTFDNSYNRALKDPAYRSQALADYDRGATTSANWSLPAFTADSLWNIAGYIIFGAIALVVLGVLWAIIQKSGERKPPPQPVPDTTYGSADWAEPVDGPPNEDYIFNGVFFGKSSRPELADVPLEEHLGGPVCGEKKTNTIICAQTRTGKGSRVILPTLLRYTGSPAGQPPAASIFCIDPKGENCAVSSRVRRSLPNDVHIINPWGEFAQLYQQYGFKPATYNPLDVLDANDPNVVSVATSMAAAICPPEPDGKNPFWTSNAAAILTAVLLWVTYIKNETKTLGRVREILTRSKKDFQDNFLAPMAACKDLSISDFSARFVGMAPETYSGIMSNVQQYTDFLSDPQVKAATAASTFSMKDLLTKPTTVYLVIPFDMIATQRTWLRLLITAAMQTYRKHGKTGTVNRCMFLIDELPALGKIEELTAFLTQMSGLGVDFVLAMQSLDQLRVAYGDKGYGIIMGNCAYKWFCNIDDIHTADFLSKTLGKKTVTTVGQGTTTSMGQGGGSSGTSTTLGKTGRPLLMPDEILQLGRNTAILLGPNSKPRYLRTVDYWDLTKAFAHLEKRYPGMYWKPRITWDENPLPH